MKSIKRNKPAILWIWRIIYLWCLPISSSKGSCGIPRHFWPLLSSCIHTSYISLSDDKSEVFITVEEGFRADNHTKKRIKKWVPAWVQIMFLYSHQSSAYSYLASASSAKENENRANSWLLGHTCWNGRQASTVRPKLIFSLVPSNSCYRSNGNARPVIWKGSVISRSSQALHNKNFKWQNHLR